MASRVDQRQSLIDAALDSVLPFPDLDLDASGTVGEPAPRPEPVLDPEPAERQLPLWDIEVPPPRAAAAVPPGGRPELPRRGQPAPPEPAPPEPEPPEPEPPEPEPPAAPRFREVVEPEPEREAEAVVIVARFDDLERPDEPGKLDEHELDELDPAHGFEQPIVESLPRSVLATAAVEWARTLPRSVRRAAAGALATGVLIAGAVAVALPGGGDPDTPAASAPAPVVDTNVARVAQARLPLLDVYERPNGPAVLATLEHPLPSGTPLTFAVEGEWNDWYKVMVPTPPAGTTGWVRAADVDVSEHEVRVTVDLHDRLLVAREGGEIVLRAPIAVGHIDAPSEGRSFVAERVTVSNPRAGYGSHALPLAGYANGDETYFRGQGLVAIHGTDDPLSLGQTTTRGSIALAPDDIRTLYDLAPLGAPVDVVDTSPALAADSPGS